MVRGCEVNGVAGRRFKHFACDMELGGFHSCVMGPLTHVSNAEE